LDDAADLFVSADHGIYLVLKCQLGEIAPIALERLVLAFRVLVGHPLAASYGAQALEDRITRRARCAQQLGGL